jgi:hypothetical protein
VVCAYVGALIYMLNDFEAFVEEFSATFGYSNKQCNQQTSCDHFTKDLAQ